jgi:hypothetical protein
MTHISLEAMPFNHPLRRRRTLLKSSFPSIELVAVMDLLRIADGGFSKANF